MAQLLLAVLIASTAMAGCGAPAANTGAMQRPAGYDPARDPARDLADLIPTARASHQRILLLVGGEWCIWCHYLHDFLETDAEIGRLWNERFLTLKVNWSPENTNATFLSQYPPIPGYPHIFVLDEDGRLLHSQDTSLLESGRGYSPDAVRAFLERWSAPAVVPGSTAAPIPPVPPGASEAPVAG